MSEVQSGVAQSGNPWYRQTIVVDVAGYNGSFRKIALQASGNVVGDIEQLQIGSKVEISYQVTAREYNGKWYNNVDLYKIESLAEQQPTAPAAPRRRPASSPQIPTNTPMDLQDGDLPAEFFQ